MKFTVCVLCLIAGLIVGAESIKVSLMANVLKPDLDVILKYNERSRQILPAFIHWPKSIMFRVSQKLTETGVKYLKIDGLFKYKKPFSTTYEALYYSNENFYFKTKTGIKRPVIPGKLVSYQQPPQPEKAVPYLSIRYFSMEEIQKAIKTDYEANKLHFDTVMYENPATFLLNDDHNEGQFLEYTYRSKVPYPEVAEGALRVLIGQASGKKVAIKDNIQAYRLVFDQRTQTLEIPRDLNIHTAPVENVLGVRMATTGYLGVVSKNYKVKTVNTHDLYVGSNIPERHLITGGDLLAKVQDVEPRLSYENVDLSKQTVLPTGVMFQVQGNVLVKKVNYLTSGGINRECPFIIEYLQQTKTFAFKGQKVRRLCTDDITLSAYE